MPEQPYDVTGGPLAGAAYRTGSSRRHPARVVRSADGRTLRLIELDGGALLAEGAPESISREPRLGSLPSEVTLPGGWRFETSDHNGLDAVLVVPPLGRLHRWEAFHPRLVLAIPALVALGYVAWRWGLGALVALAVAATPASVPRAIDDSTLRVIDRLVADPSRLGDRRRDEVRQIFDRLRAAAGASPYGEYRLRFRSIPEIGPNAFAMPGGTIVVTDALIREFPDDDTIAGVLAHELAHVAEDHVLEQLYRSTGMRLLGAVVFGELGPVLEGAASEGEALLSLAYSREHEAEADRMGVGLAATAGYDPEGLARLFEELDSRNVLPESSWWSSHPAPAERIADIRRFAEELRR